MLAKPKRRWYQFTLRTLIVLTTIVGFGLGYVGYERRLAQHQHETKVALQKLGVYLDGGGENSSPDWLKRVLGGDSAASPIFLSVRSGHATNSAATMNDTIGKLKQFKTVTFLVVEDKQLGDEELAHFLELTQIQCVLLQETQVTDRGLQELRKLISLKQLNLVGTQTTDAGLKEVANHQSLEALWLWGTKITDAGLQELRPLMNLRLLDLSNTNVSDLGLADLRGLTQLRALYIGRTHVTDAGVAELQKALPNCEIVR